MFITHIRWQHDVCWLVTATSATHFQLALLDAGHDQWSWLAIATSSRWVSPQNPKCEVLVRKCESAWATNSNVLEHQKHITWWHIRTFPLFVQGHQMQKCEVRKCLSTFALSHHICTFGFCWDTLVQLQQQRRHAPTISLFFLEPTPAVSKLLLTL